MGWGLKHGTPYSSRGWITSYSLECGSIYISVPTGGVSFQRNMKGRGSRGSCPFMVQVFNLIIY